jgi:hypothetical protein
MPEAMHKRDTGDVYLMDEFIHPCEDAPSVNLLRKVEQARRVVHHCRPAYMIACLIAGDAISLLMAGIIAVLLKQLPHDTLQGFNPYLSLITLLPVFLLVYAAIGLYSGISLGSPEELRRLTLSSVIVSLSLGVVTFPYRGTGTVFTWTMAEALVLTVIFVPLTRVCLRLKFANVGW